MSNTKWLHFLQITIYNKGCSSRVLVVFRLHQFRLPRCLYRRLQELQICPLELHCIDCKRSGGGRLSLFVGLGAFHILQESGFQKVARG